MPRATEFNKNVDLSELTIPDQHGQQLIVPSIEEAAVWLRNSRSVTAVDSRGNSIENRLDFCGIDLPSLRQNARRSAIQLAIGHTAEYRTDVTLGVGESGELPIVMGGHQPDLFHCGVWFKNFLLSEIARRSGGLAIHFLVDNDLCRTTSIQVPSFKSSDKSNALHNEQPRWNTEPVYYDSPRDPLPWENCYLQDTVMWHSFPDRVRQNMPGVKGEPLIVRLWQHTLDAAKSGAKIGYLLSRARHRLEQELGLRTLEVPLSDLVSTPEFARFSLHLLHEIPKLHEIYNTELSQYRQRHRIRNHAQPLPNLGKEGDWYETPWWFYFRGSQVRHPLWVYFTNRDIVLSNRQDWQLRLAEPVNSESAIDQWLKEFMQDKCLRPRALLTTMYARLILSDLFVHGLGGARYDQLTDRIMARFFGLPPPPVVHATATLHLPFSRVPDELHEPPGPKVQWWQQLLRVFQSNPEAGFRQWSQELPAEQMEELHRLQVAKQSLLANIPPKGQKWEWHTSMKQINERLAELARPSVDKIQVILEQLQSVQDLSSIVNSREFSFCLFPVETIVQFLKTS